MAPHNMNEAIDGIIAYIDKDNISISELNEIIKGPDFPTGAQIMGTEGIKEAYETGRGKITVRAVAEIKTFKNNREKIVITELPYQVNKSSLIMKIAELAKNKVIDGISNITDASNRKGINIIVELKRDANAEVVLNKLANANNFWNYKSCPCKWKTRNFKFKGNYKILCWPSSWSCN